MFNFNPSPSKKGFNAIVNSGNPVKGNHGFITYKKQSSALRFFNFVAKEFPEWKFATVYRRSDNFKWTVKPSSIGIDIPLIDSACR